MSVLFYPESIRILGSDASGNNVMLCEMAVDDIANLPAANAFISDGYVLSMGCTAIAINDNSRHRLNGAGTWVQVEAGTSTYTRAEIDAMLSAIDAEIDYAVNTGVKNLFPYGDLTGITTNFSDKPFSIQAGDYKLSFQISATTGSYAIRVKDASNNSIFYETGSNSATTKTYDMTLPVNAATITFYSSVSNNFTNIMVRRAEITDPSYEPYAPTNRELYEMILQLQAE